MRWLALMVLLAALVPGRADAKADEPAREHFLRGRQAHGSGDYPQAIVEYQAAYSLAPLPELLFNIAQCYRLAGRNREAILYYERYLDAVPAGGVSEDAREHVEALRTAAAPPPSTQPPPLPPAPSSPAPEPDRGPVAWRWVSLGIAGSGLALLGVGVYFGAQAASAARDLEDASGPFDDDLAALDADRRADVRRMWIIGGIGAGALVTGVTLFLWKGQRERRIGARPTVGAHGVGVSVYGRF
jgi:tetratricopeptide (TPR) repeat protein